MDSTPTTNALGADAEGLATRTLLDHDYEIVEHNYRCNAGELDIVARQGDTLVFVEVRSRADGEHGSALEMIDHRKQRQVVRVAGHYLLERDPPYEEIRFDVVAITGGEIDLIADAFRPGR
jgi:putative endonuclease